LSSIHGLHLASAVEAVNSYTGKVHELIQSIRHLYTTKKRIKKLRKSFYEALQGSHSVSQRRKIAGNWRCIQYAIENQVPREFFVITNYGRMVEKMKGCHEETEESESVSSTFEEILESPLPLDYHLHYPVDLEKSAANIEELPPILPIHEETNFADTTQNSDLNQNCDRNGKSGKTKKSKKRRKVRVYI
jgi:hypothetical protein